MRRLNCTMIFNHEDWGLAGFESPRNRACFGLARSRNQAGHLEHLITELEKWPYFAEQGVGFHPVASACFRKWTLV